MGGEKKEEEENVGGGCNLLRISYSQFLEYSFRMVTPPSLLLIHSTLLLPHHIIYYSIPSRLNRFTCCIRSPFIRSRRRKRKSQDCTFGCTEFRLGIFTNIAGARLQHNTIKSCTYTRMQGIMLLLLLLLLTLSFSKDYIVLCVLER